MVRVLPDIGRLGRKRVSGLPLDTEIPLIGNRRAIVRIGGMNAHPRETGGRGGSNVRDGTSRTRSAERGEALIEGDLAGGNASVGSNPAPLADQIDVPWSVGRQTVEFAR